MDSFKKANNYMKLPQQPRADEVKCTEMVLLENGRDSDQVENDSEPIMATMKSEDEAVLQARDTNTSVDLNFKAKKQGNKNQREEPTIK